MLPRRRGGEATLDGEPLRAPDRSDLATALVATGFGYEAGVRAAQARQVAELLPQVRDIRRIGSAALDLAWTGGRPLRRLLRARRPALGCFRRAAALRESAASRSAARGTRGDLPPGSSSRRGAGAQLAAIVG